MKVPATVASGCAGCRARAGRGSIASWPGEQRLSYLPHSGAVLATLGAEVAGYEATKGSLKFGIDSPLPKRLVEKLVDARLGELGFR